VNAATVQEKSLSTDSPLDAYCLNCLRYQPVVYSSQTKTIGGFMINSPGPVHPVAFINQTDQITVCAKCGRRVYGNRYKDEIAAQERKAKTQRRDALQARSPRLFTFIDKFLKHYNFISAALFAPPFAFVASVLSFNGSFVGFWQCFSEDRFWLIFWILYLAITFFLWRVSLLYFWGRDSSW
jgi:hypothetical protein